MAAGYALAWAFVCIPFMISFFFLNSNATRKKLTWRQAFIKAYMSRGERRRIDRNLSSRNTRTGSWAWTSLMQRAQSSLNSVLSRTSTPRRDMRSNDESNARTTTKNDQSSTNPTQVSAPAEKLSSTNPHLPDDMKEAEGSNTLQRPQQEEYLATDGDDEEKCEEEQKGSSRLR
jgi:Tfp pilus assembly protein PilW